MERVAISLSSRAEKIHKHHELLQTKILFNDCFFLLIAFDFGLAGLSYCQGHSLKLHNEIFLASIATTIRSYRKPVAIAGKRFIWEMHWAHHELNASNRSWVESRVLKVSEVLCAQFGKMLLTFGASQVCVHESLLKEWINSRVSVANLQKLLWHLSLSSFLWF